MNNMPRKTQRLTNAPEDIRRAAELLRQGELVGIPTETVYGLAADALNGVARTSSPPRGVPRTIL